MITTADLGSYKIKLAFVPTIRKGFGNVDLARKRKVEIMEKLDEWQVDYVDLEWLNENGILDDPGDVEDVAKKLHSEEIDAVFCPHCSFGTEAAVARLARKFPNTPFLLWGPLDEQPRTSWDIVTDSQCGLFATSKAMHRVGAPFTYIVNTRLNAPVFTRGFCNFIAAAAGVRALKSPRIGQIDTRPTPFQTVMYNEGELRELFDIEVIPTSLTHIINSARSLENSKRTDEQIDRFRSRVSNWEAGDDTIRKLAAFKLALADWAADNGCDALAIQCWDALQKGYGIFPCYVNSELAAEGLPVACETDIHGAITFILMSAIQPQGKSPFFSDLTIRHPENPNAELLWHCGPFPVDLKTKGEPGHVDASGRANWPITPGPVTLARFDGDNGAYSLAIGHARGIDGPKTIGTYLWVEVDNWPKWEQKLIYGPYIHHIVGIYGYLAPTLYEVTRYIPSLDPDLISPSEEEVTAWERGDVDFE